ncbi:MAG: serine dehydratase subunit alpha family protein [Sedimentisphaerales bacterium]|nr:serine dehydratase subunit alpha family protein [Sedimentisphaerales bacterium]
MYTIKEILRLEVGPALGCTEPAAVALCTAAAGSLLTERQLESIRLHLSPNIYKNAFAVALPGAGGNTGVDLAAALGFFGGDPRRKLEVLETVDAGVLKQAQKFLRDHPVEIELLKDIEGIYVRCDLSTTTQTAQAIIEGAHDNLVLMKYNDQPIKEHPLLSKASRNRNTIEALEEFLRMQTLEDLLRLVDTLDEEDFKFVQSGVEHNMDLARYGLQFGCGLGVGKTLERLVREGVLKRDMILSARILTSAAADARMSGAKLAAMSSAGSGNHGLTAILPIWAIKDYIDHPSEKEVLTAIALSHVVTAYIKAHTGRLSAVCGCSVAAGAGATAGITYLMGGNLTHIAGAIRNLIGDLAGVICDGAKPGCAFKLATAAGAAVQSALFSLHGINIAANDGIMGNTAEQTTRNIGQISTKGMIETDRTILQIMMAKQLFVKE